MQKFEYVVTDTLGLHARPAGKLAKEVQKFKCAVTAQVNNREADARKIFKLMKLGIKHGQTVCFVCEGEDERQAAESLQKFCGEIL